MPTGRQPSTHRGHRRLSSDCALLCVEVDRKTHSLTCNFIERSIIILICGYNENSEIMIASRILGETQVLEFWKFWNNGVDKKLLKRMSFYMNHVKGH